MDVNFYRVWLPCSLALHLLLLPVLALVRVMFFFFNVMST